MNQANPGEGQFDSVVDFLNMLTGIIEDRLYPDEAEVIDKTEAMEFIEDEWPKIDCCWQRVLFAGATAIENACDPNDKTLSFKPEIALAIEQFPRLTAALHKAKAHPDYTYITTPAGHAERFPEHAQNGWERCPEAETPGSGDEVWRARKPS